VGKEGFLRILKKTDIETPRVVYFMDILCTVGDICRGFALLENKFLPELHGTIHYNLSGNGVQ
jgi:hypothetical protein